MLQWTTETLLENIRSDKPNPGGGGVSALVGAYGIDLNIMALKIQEKSLQKSIQKDYNKRLEECINIQESASEIKRQKLSDIQNLISFLKVREEQLIDYANRDGASFQKVLDAMRLPKDDSNRASRIEEGYIYAIEIPMKIIETLIEVSRVQLDILTVTKKSTLTDVTSGYRLIQAAIDNVSDNVWVNLMNVKDSNAYNVIKEKHDKLVRQHQKYVQMFYNKMTETWPSYNEWKEGE